jgi:hypothetical protein
MYFCHILRIYETVKTKEKRFVSSKIIDALMSMAFELWKDWRRAEDELPVVRALGA